MTPSSIQAPPPPQRAHFPARPPARVARSSAPDWSSLAPAGAYGRTGRRLFNAAMVALLLPPALCVGSVVALVNACAFRSLRKVFFVQPRAGLHGRPFRLYKFRTMSEPRASAHESWKGGEDVQRVTRLGRFLRSTHLDELPQLVNVLRGDMMLIGPRPEMIEVEAWAGEHVPGFSHRLAIKPGLTGLAQITQGYTGADVKAYEEKLAINLDYLRRCSLALDVQIVVRTVVWMLRGRGWGWRRAKG